MKSWIEVEHKTEPIGAGPEKVKFQEKDVYAGGQRRK